ncbi:hypothetical protein GQF01_14210 [Paenibacillus sp. 5J-6]|uniref:Copper resistance protein D domain-containing protein n=1 Tax=Paenibacillus silvestris TaxID=2606219 RepID=A0A6L8UYY2_9BACL|nr:hypothetical protein [Paenibacillus silvestris]MZQ83265.1 hypothetical protein [Paenibacillus silvestris]
MNILLLIHLMAVCAWVGGAIYERFFVLRAVDYAKGTNYEARMVQIMLKAVPYFKVVTALLILSGLAMILINAQGSFSWFVHWSWLSLKVYIMIALMVFGFGFINPLLNKVTAHIKLAIEKDQKVTDETRAAVRRIGVLLDIAHFGVIVNVILGVTKFF